MGFTEVNINKKKDNLYVGKVLTLPLHQDVKHRPWRGFRTVKVFCKQELPSTWLKYSFIHHCEMNFSGGCLWACLERQCSCSFLSLVVSDAFFYCYFPALERGWVDKRGIPAPTEVELSSAWGFNEYGDKEVKVTCRNSKCSDFHC